MRKVKRERQTLAVQLSGWVMNAYQVSSSSSRYVSWGAMLTVWPGKLCD